MSAARTRGTIGSRLGSVAREVRERAEAAAVDLILAGFGRLPPARASDVGGAILRTIGPLLPVSNVARRNLARAMPELDPAARRRVVRAVWDNLGRNLGEFPHLAGLRKDAPEGPGWEMVGEAHLLSLVRDGGPAIFVSGHIGNWEMLPTALAWYGIRMVSMYRAPDNERVDARLLAMRRRAVGLEADGSEAILLRKGAQGARQSLKLLAGGGFLGLLVDQKMNDGVCATFFGLEAMTAPALAALALRYRCTIIPGHVERVGPARFRLICEAPMALPQTGVAADDRQSITQAMNDRLEAWIRERPGSWLWLHRRWPKPIR